MTDAIVLRSLKKRYGTSTALAGIDLTVPRGSVYGFLGPNGAGKTTTLRILNGLAGPTSGTAHVVGHPAGSTAARTQVGFLPDVPGYYEWMTAREFLSFAGGLFGLSGPALSERVRVLLDLAGLTGVTTRIGGYSRGMKQRLGIAQALVNAPALLMLDEPTSALDPIGRRDVLDMIASLAGRTTVFFSTHILADVERVCDTVAILDEGRVVVEAPIDELTARYGAHRVVVEVDRDAESLAAALAVLPWAAAASVGGDGRIEITVSDMMDAGRDIARLVAESGRSLVRFEPGEVSLEDVFVELVGGGGGARE